jgi:SAM-dependent methyltransferase
MAFVCRICENADNNRAVTAREMMFGTRETFDYFECSECGTVQICEVPDLAPHYPNSYLAFDSKIEVAETLSRRIAVSFAGKYLLEGKSSIGKLVLAQKPWVKDHFPASMREYPMGLRAHSRILDFGCGTGKLLQSLHYFGFTDLTGADAFIQKDISYPTGVNIYKRSLADLEPAYDLIMLHHSFEHLPDPLESLQQVRRLMHNDSYCLVRIPIASYAWEEYGVNWVQMDPPRHLFLYTENSFRMLAGKADLTIEHVTYDSGSFQFWGSELYIRDIPLLDERSPWTDPKATTFSPEQMTEWQKQAEDLNAEGRGDMACFYLRRT